jgi:hypothetical protein
MPSPHNSKAPREFTRGCIPPPHLLKDPEEKIEPVQQIELTHFYGIAAIVTNYKDYPEYLQSEYEYCPEYLQSEYEYYLEYLQSEYEYYPEYLQSEYEYCPEYLQSEYEYCPEYLQSEYCKHKIYLESLKIGLEQISYKQRKMEEAIFKVPRRAKYKLNKSLSRPETFPIYKKEKARRNRQVTRAYTSTFTGPSSNLEISDVLAYYEDYDYEDTTQLEYIY